MIWAGDVMHLRFPTPVLPGSGRGGMFSGGTYCATPNGISCLGRKYVPNPAMRKEFLGGQGPLPPTEVPSVSLLSSVITFFFHIDKRLQYGILFFVPP
jgi:hypothetical protein